MENNREAYINYLVRKVSEGVIAVMDEKIEQLKNEYINIEYKTSLEKTEEILKTYKKLKHHIELTKFEKDELNEETKESHNEEIQQMMTEIFSESESYLKSLLRSRYKTRALICFIDKVIENYLKTETNDDLEIRKRKILKEIYVEGINQTNFVYENYDNDRTFYRDRTKLIKDLAPYFFGIEGIEI